MTRISDMTPLTSLSSGSYVPVEKTGSTTNYRYDLSNLSNLNGLFVNATGLTIPVGVDVISTTGYASLGVGAANYIYDAAVDAAYVATYPRASFISANSRGFRLDSDQDIHVDMFGAVGDYNGTTGTDNAAAFVATMVYLQQITEARPDVGVVWNLGNALSLRNGGRYYTTAPLNIKTNLDFVDFTGAEIIIPADTFGIVINTDTTDVEATRASGPFPYFCTLLNPRVRGHNGTDRTKHGIWMRRTAFIFNPHVVKVSGDGIRIGDSNGHTTGNQNGWRVENPYISQCGGSGMHAEGSDANTGTCINYNIELCGRFAVTDLSVLANKWNGQSSGCGVLQAGVNTVPAYVYHAGTGHNWAIIAGQEANTTVTPSASRPDVWIDLGASAGTDPAIANWTSGITMLAGGSLRSLGSNAPVQFDKPYMESGPYSAWQLNTNSIIRDLTGNTIGIGGVVEYSSNGALQNNAAYRVSTTDSTGTSFVQLGGYGVGGVNFYGQMQDTAGHNWIWRSDGGYFRLMDNQVSQPLIATPLPGSGLNFGRSTDQPGTAFFYQLGIGYPNTGRIVDMNTAAPVSGNHAQGELVWNNAATLTAPSQWICTSVGTPGTWVANYVNARADPSTGIGYVTGAGGAVTQATSRVTGVTLNKICGAITLFSAAGSATYATFTVTNSAVAATDVIRVVQKSGADKYIILVTAVGAGSFDITFATTGGTTTEQPVFNFAVVKAVAA